MYAVTSGFPLLFLFSKDIIAFWQLQRCISSRHTSKGHRIHPIIFLPFFFFFFPANHEKVPHLKVTWLSCPVVSCVHTPPPPCARWVLQHLQLILVPRALTKKTPNPGLIYLDLKGITEIESATRSSQQIPEKWAGMKRRCEENANTQSAPSVRSEKSKGSCNAWWVFIFLPGGPPNCLLSLQTSWLSSIFHYSLLIYQSSFGFPSSSAACALF